MDKHFWADILSHAREDVWWKKYDSAPNHSTLYVQKFLANNDVMADLNPP